MRSLPARRAALSALCGALLATFLLAGSVAATPAGAQTACAGLDAYSISGTIQGQDGAFINAQIGLNAVDQYGHSIAADGCNSGGAYTKNIFVNTDVSGLGTFDPTGHTRTWSFAGLPANTASVWVEVYTRTNLGSECPTCDGQVDTSRYGFVNRRAIPVNTHGLGLTAPLACGVTSNGVTGSTGRIVGRFTDAAGDLVAGSATAWSQAVQSPMPLLQGWGEASEPTTGSYLISTLAAAAPYTVLGTIAGRTTRVNELQVPACGTAVADFGPGQLGSHVALAPGGPSGTVAAWRAPNGQAHVAVLRSGTLTDISSLGGSLAGAPAVAFAGSTELVVVRGSNSELYADTDSGAGWSGWRAIGGDTLAAPALSAPGNGTVWLAVTGENRAVYLRRFSTAGWSGWTDLGGASLLSPALSTAASGAIRVAVTGTNHALYTGVLAPHWSGWADLGGGVSSAPALAVDPADGAVRFVVAGSGGVLWTRTLSAGWSRTGGSSAGAVGLAPAGSDLEMITRGADGFPYSTPMKAGVAGLFSFAG